MTRERVEPMVRGLFPAVEQDTMLALLQGSVVFLTPENISEVLHAQSFDHSAWDLANLYLGSIDAELLNEQAVDLLGLSQETTCFVTARYLEGRDKFDDFIVHEAAHVFHNWKREHAGLPFTRTKEWLLPIEFRKRETFAYSCEVYSRIVEQGRTPKQRQALFAEYAGAPVHEPRVFRVLRRRCLVDRRGQLLGVQQAGRSPRRTMCGEGPLAHLANGHLAAERSRPPRSSCREVGQSRVAQHN